jgi:hypothetical protein
MSSLGKYYLGFSMVQPLASSSALSEAVLVAVDDGLSVPGEIVRAAIYDRIERSYQGDP